MSLPAARPFARGRLKTVDLDAVRKAPGVVAVLTAADIPGENNVGPVKHDDPIFAEEMIEFHNQVVFAVVAETREAARRAVLLAKIEMEPETPLVTVDDALTADTHVLPDSVFSTGDSAAALGASAHRLAGTLRIGGQEQFYLEGQVSLAIPGEDDMLVHTSSQHPSELQHLIAHVLDVPVAAVTVEVRRMGGGFGGKETQAAQWAAIAALAAGKTGRPCKMRLDRDDDMVMTGKRHDFRADFEVGFDDDRHDRRLRRLPCGALRLFGRPFGRHQRPRDVPRRECLFPCPAATILSKRMKTNTVSNTAFRGFGGPQGMMAIERAIDAIAWSLGLDPLDVRKRNLYGEGRDFTPYGMQVTDNILPELIETLERTSDYRARRAAITDFNRGSPILKRGLALTPVKFGIAFNTLHLNQAGALVHVYQDGSVHLNHGGTEMGQGLFIKVAQVVAEEFGIDLDRVKITATTTAKVPNTSATAASSGSDLNGMAARVAAATIKGRLVDFAAETFGVAADQITFRENQVFAGNEAIAFADLIRKAYLGRVSLSSTGFYRTPKIHFDAKTAKGPAVLLFLLRRLLRRGRRGHHDRRNEGDARRHPSRRRPLAQSGGRYRPDRGRLRPGHGLADHRGTGVRRPRAPAHPRALDLQDSCSSDVPADFRVALFDGANREETIYRSKAVGEPPLMLAIAVFAAVADAIHSLAPDKPVPLDAPATPESILHAVRSLTQH